MWVESGNSALDMPFGAVQLVGLIWWCVALALRWHTRPKRLAATVIVAVILSPGLAAAWNTFYPPISGITAAGRFFFGAGLNAANTVMSSIVLVLMRRVGVSRISLQSEFSSGSSISTQMEMDSSDLMSSKGCASRLSPVVTNRCQFPTIDDWFEISLQVGLRA